MCFCACTHRILSFLSHVVSYVTLLSMCFACYLWLGFCLFFFKNFLFSQVPLQEIKMMQVNFKRILLLASWGAHFADLRVPISSCMSNWVVLVGGGSCWWFNHHNWVCHCWVLNSELFCCKKNYFGDLEHKVNFCSRVVAWTILTPGTLLEPSALGKLAGELELVHMVIEWYPCCMHDTHLLNNIHWEKYCPFSSICALHNINGELRISKINASYFFMVSGYATGKCSGQSKEFVSFSIW